MKAARWLWCFLDGHVVSSKRDADGMKRCSCGKVALDGRYVYLHRGAF